MFSFPLFGSASSRFLARLSSHERNSPPDCCSRLRRPAGPCEAGVRFEPLRTQFHKKQGHPKGGLVFCGAGDEARTRYLDLGKVALYQMSYARKRKVDYSA